MLRKFFTEQMLLIGLPSVDPEVWFPEFSFLGGFIKDKILSPSLSVVQRDCKYLKLLSGFFPTALLEGQKHFCDPSYSFWR